MNDQASWTAITLIVYFGSGIVFTARLVTCMTRGVAFSEIHKWDLLVLIICSILIWPVALRATPQFMLSDKSDN